MEEKGRERIRVNFNATIKNIWGEDYRSANGSPLTLGRVAVDAIEAATASKAGAIEPDEKLRLADLARRIVNTKLDGRVEEVPYNTLMLPKRVIEKVDGHIGNAGFVTGVYASCHQILYGEDAALPSFDDIEEVPWEPVVVDAE